MNRKGNIKKIFAFFAAIAVLMTAIPFHGITSQAAAKKANKITLSKTSATMLAGGTLKLKVRKVSPSGASKAVTWKTSNKKRATVTAGGVVKAKKAGTVRITAVSKANPKAKVSCKITIYNKTKKLQLVSSKSYTLSVGVSMQLEARVTSPASRTQPVRWTSSNADVASISKTGLVKAVSKGAAKMTAKSGGKSVSVNITVEDTEIPEAGYIVTFDTAGGSAVASQSVTGGRPAVKPTDPVREGYTFGGWYMDSTLTAAYDFASAVTGNLTLYAKWDAVSSVTCKVAFQTNGGNAITEQTVRTGEKVTKPADPVKLGFEFAGWYTDSFLKKAYDFDAAVTQDITLYARWRDTGNGSAGGSTYVPSTNPSPSPSPSPIVYTVTFDSNGGSAVEPQTVEKNGLAKRPADPTRDGYIFDGWYADANAESEYNFTLAVKGNLNLHAKWTPIASLDGAGDQEKDGVINEIESLFGSDPLKDDTDDDGLSDYVEIYVLATDPTKADSNSDGITDADDDADGDGLTNIEESRIGTNLIIADTDHDSLSDFEEVKSHGTDPLKSDTDGDGILDGDEISFGLNPLDSSDSADLLAIDQVLSKEQYDESLLTDNEAIPAVSGTSDQVLDRSVSLSESSEISLDENRAVVGKGVELEFAGNADLTLSFAIPDDVVSAAVMMMDENGSWIPAKEGKAVSDGDSGRLATAHVTENGTYCVMDLERLFQLLGIDTSHYYDAISGGSDAAPAEMSLSLNTKEGIAKSGSQEQNSNDNDASGSVALSNEALAILAGSEDGEPAALAEPSVTPMGQADIAFVIDTTGSMSDEISNVANNIITFAQKLNSDYNVNVNFGLVDYRDIVEDGTDSTRVVKDGTSNWFTSTHAFQTAVSELTVGGGGDTPETAVDALECARRLNFRYSAKKFIILVTDADYKNDNNYGIVSMESEIALLKRDGIITSVVTPSSEQSTYQDLYEQTGGIYANIYGNFGMELLRLADMIGAEVSKGNWILLNDYQYVALDHPLAADSGDTDGDGISDWDELKPSIKLNLTSAMKKWLLGKGIPESMIDDYFSAEDGVFITVYPYHSNPVLEDTDFDGIDDAEDSARKSNKFKGRSTRLKDWEAAATADISFTMDYTAFFNRNTVYQKDISVLSSLLAADIYEGKNGVYIEVTDGASLTENHSPIELLKLFGMEDVIKHHIGDGSDNDETDILAGHRLVTYNGRTQDILALVVRGTDGTFKEWSSNFDVGADTAQYTALTGSHPDWMNKNNHKGFDVTATRVKRYIDSYIETYMDPSADKVIWITGHSRGAAIANILGQNYESDTSITSFTYTFASPTTTTAEKSVAEAYTSVFNVINSDDLIPCLPLDDNHVWGFRRYGVDKSISIAEKYEDHNPLANKSGTFEALVNMDYNNNGKIDGVLAAFEKIASNRAELYVYTGEDDTIEWLGINHFGFDAAQKDADKFERELDSTMKQFCKVKVWNGKDGFGVSKYRAGCEQTPAYFMQVLALIAAKSSDGIVSAVGTIVVNAVADKYESARNKFVVIGNDITGGLNHPHWTESYYLITSNDFLPL